MLTLIRISPADSSYIVEERGVMEEGQCAMRGHCGRSMTTFRELPCPYNGPPVEVSFHMLEDYHGLSNDPLKPDDDAKRVLADVCG